jgi:hypothetical protein
VNGLTSRISPEIVAGALSVVLVVALIGVRAPSGTASTPNASESPATSVQPTASDSLPAIVRSALETVVVVNLRLATTGQALERELSRTVPRASEVAVALPLITAQVTGVAQPVTVLVADPATATLGLQLSTIYGSLADLIRAAQRESVQNAPAYVQAGKSSVVLIQKLEPLTARAQAILAGALESPSPSPSSAVTPAPSGSVPASSAPVPSSTRGSPAPSAVEGGLIVNAGFEDGVTPWVLEVVAPAAATLTVDPSSPAVGAASARVDIATGTDARSGISLVQPGLGLRAGQTYTVRLLVRATEARDLRVRLAATNGDAYVARILPVGTSWTTISFTFDVLVDDSAAVLGIDLGRSTATTWVDAVALTPGG